ncbi:MAG: phosphatase PAP2 family protein [Oscillospiraceae bacterium]|nr:phosphatase PAP2 family protein [Oscillospiraceae bacterium]
MTMKKRLWLLPAALWAGFVLFTLLLTCVDVQAIGPQGTAVGFATVNEWAFQLLGVHLLWYHLTDWLGVAAIAFAFGFAVAGLYQWVKRKSIRKVDRHILALGGFYLLVIGCYLFFEKVVINCRPILMDGSLEASYPSSHTMIVVSIIATAAMAFRALCPQKKGWCLAVDIFAAVVIAVTVIGRLIAGVHWLTDIVGGLLLSAALVVSYWAACRGE